LKWKLWQPHLLTKIFKMCLRPENCMIIVQLQARNLSEFFSVKEKEASSNKFSSLEGGSSRHLPIQCFQNLKISYVSQILQWIPTKPNDREAKGSLLELFQKDFLRIYHWQKVVCLFCLFITFRSPKPQCLLPCSWYHRKALDE
jgi:hypothetical protein